MCLLMSDGLPDVLTIIIPMSYTIPITITDGKVAKVFFQTFRQSTYSLRNQITRVYEQDRQHLM